MTSDGLGQLYVGLQSYSALQSCFKLGEDGQTLMLPYQSVTDMVYPAKGKTKGKAALCGGLSKALLDNRHSLKGHPGSTTQGPSFLHPFPPGASHVTWDKTKVFIIFLLTSSFPSLPFTHPQKSHQPPVKLLVYLHLFPPTSTILFQHLPFLPSARFFSQMAERVWCLNFIQISAQISLYQRGLLLLAHSKQHTVLSLCSLISLSFSFQHLNHDLTWLYIYLLSDHLLPPLGYKLYKRGDFYFFTQCYIPSDYDSDWYKADT